MGSCGKGWVCGRGRNTASWPRRPAQLTVTTRKRRPRRPQPGSVHLTLRHLRDTYRTLGTMAKMLHRRPVEERLRTQGARTRTKSPRAKAWPGANALLVLRLSTARHGRWWIVSACAGTPGAPDFRAL